MDGSNQTLTFPPTNFKMNQPGYGQYFKEDSQRPGYD